MRYLGVLFVVVIGALTTVEAGANSQLTKSLRGPWWPGLWFGVTSALGLVLCLGVATLLGVTRPPRLAELAAVPWWAWTGGVISAGYAVSMLVFPDRLGSAVFTGATVTAAIIASVLLDHMGWVGFKAHPAGIGRLAGTALMVAGLVLVAVF